MIEARYYEKLEDNFVDCKLCPNDCRIPDGSSGRCLVRTNRNGILYADMYEKICSLSMDPIEKKPLYHFLPNTEVLSFGSYGCNLKCQFCQNHSISQSVGEGSKIKAEDIVKRAKANSNCKSIAATYNEPLINIEFVCEVFKLSREAGLKNILVTNGYVNREPLEEILELTDALNIDLKAFDVLFYERCCSGKFIPIVDNIRYIIDQKKWHVEITNLIVTSLNDSKEHINNIIDWAFNVASHVPFHFSRYFPNFQTDYPATSEKLLYKTYKKAVKKLDYVYIGNVADTEVNSTYCPKCHATLIERDGYRVSNISINKNNECENCKRPVDIVLI